MIKTVPVCLVTLQTYTSFSVFAVALNHTCCYHGSLRLPSLSPPTPLGADQVWEDDLCFPLKASCMQRFPEKEKGGRGCTSRYKHNVHTSMCLSGCTHIDVILLVTLVQVVHDGGLVQLSQCWHVLHPIDAGLVHSVHPLPGDLSLLQVQHLEDNETKFYCNSMLYTHFIYFQ